ncbi:16S rRNA (uracil(1498)-N(3))-methyltransferase [Arsenicitalea aurantiaca]|uniref:Ribosomal RNA small subunit methyltransferase E n=1 Tax=Arsenicitalea aurantiaca TaxID=1783274 RepID=A0A433XAU7_9HYPH|nr:16S rRNA (uracil(1498)-N(3))-methyltransferase [Arsenicitalea aurantiaca]RUT31182.1 16S rRNA (uracil(1498)-N(3))-methyltransferase [Arsenicitalea aurantiaca]
MPRTYKSLQRLYIDAPLPGEAPLALGREQSNYLGAVLRMRAGDEIIAFNGRDGAWRMRIIDPSKKAVTLEAVEQIAAQTPAPDLWYGFAPLKTGRLDYMVQKATEMGAGIVQPVVTRYTQARNTRIEKIRANVIEAAEQCEVLSVPEVRDEVRLETLLAEWDAQHAERILLFADEAAAPGSPIDVIGAFAGRPIGLLVGPEGGFAEEEREALLKREFVVPISLGPRILRADTAAVAALAVIQAIIGDWR